MKTISRTTPCNYFSIRMPRWKKKCVGLAKHRLGLHNKIDIMAVGKDGKRYYPNTLYISNEDIQLGLQNGYEQQHLNGITLILVPISDLVPIDWVLEGTE